MAKIKVILNFSLQISLLSVPQDGEENIVTILELSSSSLACPKDICKQLIIKCLSAFTFNIQTYFDRLDFNKIIFTQTWYI